MEGRHLVQAGPPTRPGTAQHSTGAEGSNAALLQQGICGPSWHLPPGKQASGMGWLAAVKTSGAIPRHGPPAGQRGRDAEQNNAVNVVRERSLVALIFHVA